MKQPPQTQMYDGGQMNENELQSRVEIYDDNKMNINTQHSMGKQNQEMNGEEMEDDGDDGDDGEDAPSDKDMINDTKDILAMASQIQANTMSASNDVNEAS